MTGAKSLEGLTAGLAIGSINGGRNYSLREIKSINEANGWYFFSNDTMRFFRGSRYNLYFDKEADSNFLLVTHPHNRGVAWYRFIPSTGELKPLDYEELPLSFKLRLERKVKW